MDVTYDNTNKVYIKSNTATVMRFLWFLSALLLVLVVGLCIFVAFGGDDRNNYHWDSTGQFYYTLEDNKVTIVKFVDTKAESCTIPATVNYGGKSYPVTTIGKHAFSDHRTLASVKISDNVTEVMGDAKNGTGAFSGCVALTTVDLGQGVARIGEYAFKNCLALTGVELPTSVQFVGDGAFQGCVALEKIKLNSNGVLGKDCFRNCANVTTLELADDVRLSDETRKILSGLRKLSNFIVTENNPAYQVPADSHCLLMTTDAENDTVVLGGSGAAVPTGVTQILDWAWGSRAANNLYVPSSVAKVAADSFQCDAICTDAAAKPTGWLTAISVYTNAQLITFVAEGGQEKTNYIYNQNGTMIYPEYDDLFTDKPTTPFVKWGSLSGTTCQAIYESINFVSSLDDLNAALNTAETYLNDADVRLKFTLDFWENFKTIYYTAKTINDPSTTYVYVADNLTKALEKAVEQIQVAEDETILESTDWWVGLQHLVEAIEKLDQFDLAESVDDDLIKQIYEKVETAEFIVANRGRIDAETGNSVWYALRDLYESLEVDVGVDSQLAKEIKTCEVLKRENYTKASWKKMQVQLGLARQVTAHNLSISVVRENLADARAALQEVDLIDNLTTLATWLSIVEDLTKDDYQAYEYDRLILESRTIIGKLDDLNNDGAVNAALVNLKNLYNNLVSVDNSATYKTSTGILNKKSMPYFITAVILFTGTVAAGAVATKLKFQLPQSQE